MEILTYGAGERLRVCSSELARAYTGDIRIIILPIPTTRDRRRITGTETELCEVLSQVERGTLVAGYGIPDSLSREISERGGIIYDAESDETLLSKNAELTALGAVGWILTNIKSAPSELKVGIVGYGRIGARLLRYLLFMGAKVRVFSGKAATIRELSELAIDVRDYRSSLDISGLDLLINTAPSAIVTKEAVAEAGRIKVMDLASGRYLDGIPGLIKLPSVPEAFYGESAGRLYAKRIGSYFSDRLSLGGEL